MKGDATKVEAAIVGASTPNLKPTADHARTGLRWAVSGRLGAQLFTWSANLLIFRLVSPEHFGLMNLTALAVGLFQLVNELGMTSALIQRGELTEDLARRVVAINLCLNGVLYGILYLSAPFIAGFFGEPMLADLVRVMGLVLLIGSIGMVPEAILSRGMRFKRKAAIHVTSMVVNGGVALTLALLGFGVWALVSGAVVGLWTAALLARFSVRMNLSPVLGLRGIGELFRFGGLLACSRMLVYAYSAAGRVALGKLWPVDVIGYMSVAYQIAAIPMEKLAAPINDVTLAYVSRVQGERDRVRSTLIGGSETLALVGFPALFGLAAVAPSFVPVVLGDQWDRSVILMQIICIGIPFRMLLNLLMPVMLGLGHPIAVLENSIFAAVIYGGGAIAVAPYGVEAVVVVGALGAPLLYLSMQYRLCRVLGDSVWPYVRPLVSYFAGAAAMAMVVMTVNRYVLPVQWIDMVRLPLLMFTGAAFYGGLMFAIHGNALVKKLKQLVR